ncbi:MAG: GatB/YqeY domain-containing protein [Dehalococcoidia bacterium]
MAGLHDQLREDLKEAMRARDTVRRDTIRLVEAAIKNAEIERRGPLDEAGVIRVIQKQVKQRQDSIEQFTQGGRQDLADKESAEIAVLEGYLPQQLSRDEIVAAAKETIANVGASGPQDKGKVMGPLMGALRGAADGRLVNEVVTQLLGG